VVVSVRDVLVNGSVVERVVHISGEDTPPREAIHYTAPEENATATDLCMVCVMCVIHMLSHMDTLSHSYAHIHTRTHTHTSMSGSDSGCKSEAPASCYLILNCEI